MQSRMHVMLLQRVMLSADAQSVVSVEFIDGARHHESAAGNAALLFRYEEVCSRWFMQQSYQHLPPVALCSWPDRPETFKERQYAARSC